MLGTEVSNRIHVVKSLVLWLFCLTGVPQPEIFEQFLKNTLNPSLQLPCDIHDEPR